MTGRLQGDTSLVHRPACKRWPSQTVNKTNFMAMVLNRILQVVERVLCRPSTADFGKSNFLALAHSCRGAVLSRVLQVVVERVLYRPPTADLGNNNFLAMVLSCGVVAETLGKR